MIVSSAGTTGIAYSELASPVQALNLVNPVPNALKELVETILAGDISRHTQDEVRVWPHVVVDLEQGVR